MLGKSLKSILGLGAVAAACSSKLSFQLQKELDDTLSSFVDDLSTNEYVMLAKSKLVVHADESNPISSSLLNRVTEKNKKYPNGYNALETLPSNPTENYTKRYRQFNEKVKKILESYRIQTNSPGLTAAIYFNPDSARYKNTTVSVFEIEEFDESPASAQTEKKCACGDFSCGCTSGCKPCGLRSLEHPVPRSGFVVWEGAAGLSDIELGTPMRPTTKMKIASVSKSLTAILCARLVEAGLMDLDTPIAKIMNEGNYWSGLAKAISTEHCTTCDALSLPSKPIGVTDQGGADGLGYDARILPSTSVHHGSHHVYPLPSDSPLTLTTSLPPHFDDISTRHLLSHTSGVRGYVGDEFLSSRPYPTAASSLLPFLRDPLLHAPGDQFSYTTHGYSPVSLVVESSVNAAKSVSHQDISLPPPQQPIGVSSKNSPLSCSGFKDKSFVSIIHRLLLEPLGLKEVIPCPPSGIPVLNRSKQYTRVHHTSYSSDVLSTFQEITEGANQSNSAKHTLLRLNSPQDGQEIPVSGTNPCGLPLPVYLAPYTDSSNKYSGAGYLASARDLASFGGALTGCRPFINPAILSQFWTPLTLNPKSPNEKPQTVNYGLGFSILPTGGPVSRKNGTKIGSHSDASSVTTNNTQGQLISSDIVVGDNGPWWIGRAVGHSGQAIDGSSYLLVLPDEGISVAVLSNIDQCNLKPVALDIAKEFYHAIE